MQTDTTHTTSGNQSEPVKKPVSRWRWVELGILIFFWGSVALLILGREKFNPHMGSQDSLLDGEPFYIMCQFAVWMFVTPVLFWITPRIVPDRVGWVRTLSLSVGMGIVVAVVVDLFDHVLWNALVANGAHRPVSVPYVLSNFHVLTEFFIYIAVLIAGFGRAYFLRFQAHQKEAVQLRLDALQLQRHLAEARLQALRMQINPHFLFNTLHIISDHFEEDPRTARRMIARLSDILRHTFEGTETREVTLDTEIQFLQGYLDIQRFRFEERLQVDFDIAPDVHDALIPTLILQPIVENAIKHGVSQIEDAGVISISAWREDEALHLRVEDNGPGPVSTNSNGKGTGGVGIRNTKERLSTLFGANQAFSIGKSPLGGFAVHMVLPYHTSSDYFLYTVEE